MAAQRGWLTATGGYNDRAPSERSAGAASGQTVTEMDAIRLANMMEMDGDLHTILRQHHVTTHVRDDLTDTERTARKSGVRRVTTRHVRQTTTITRGETSSVTENVSHLGSTQQQYYYAASERDASRHEERVDIPAIDYRPVAPQRTYKRAKVVKKKKILK